MASRSKRKKIPDDYDKLLRFGQRHFNYVNQMLGDKSTREIITEEFPNASDWTLETSVDDHYGAHHFCTRPEKGRRRKLKWCSVDEGIQCINENPTDVLCQSYSVLYYMGRIKGARGLTKELQISMVKMWRDILKKKPVVDHIMYASRLGTSKKEIKKGVAPVWKDHTKGSPKPVGFKRGKASVRELRKVLKEWEEYGWRYFMLHPHEIPDDQLKFLMESDPDSE